MFLIYFAHNFKQSFKLQHFGNRQNFMRYTDYAMALINNFGVMQINVKGTLRRYEEEMPYGEEKKSLDDNVSTIIEPNNRVQ